MTYMATPQQKNPCPEGHEIYNFVLLFLVHFYYMLRSSDICLYFKEIMSFHYMTFIATLQQKSACPGVMSFTIWQTLPWSPLLYTVCLNHVSEQRRRFLLKKYITFYPKSTVLWGGGFMKLTISCLLTLQMLHTKFSEDKLSSS